MITYETNRYSVPPEYIGQLLTLKVDPLSRDAEVLGPRGSLRCFSLQPAGARKKVVCPEDYERLKRRLAHDRRAVSQRRTPRRRHALLQHVEVEIRSPAAYTIFAEDAEARITL